MKIIFGRPYVGGGEEISRQEARRLMAEAIVLGEKMESPSHVTDVTSPAAMQFMEWVEMIDMGQWLHHNGELNPFHHEPNEIVLMVVVRAWQGDRRLTKPFYIRKIVGVAVAEQAAG